ncbi:alpha-L-rhamnosidase [Mucilaginibacter pineti]|uniref:Alpha-L-rhamnosidase n=1 Tax=Mucilaginibacter pineti TaxID=1391627 RepID=A0A1G6ST94_9SPHI|nr:family 78 glycoside hydrolase catalytic domain [Mucilaginibacter pineti]SDD19881.1 alpha-L-rhamnosidase [Mucilaginibacter pineti]
MKKLYITLLIISSCLICKAQLPPVFDAGRAAEAQSTETVRKYLSPVRILWKSADAGSHITNAETLLKKGKGQADLSGTDLCVLTSTVQGKPGILLDYGKELQGGLQLITDQSRGGKPIRVRIRFGESASEAMSSIDTVKGATNDHAMRDFIVSVPWLGKLEIGNTGFRFVRIDLIDDNAELKLKEARAIFIYRDIPYLGSFKCSDTLLNKIWLTGAYTVHLNMQDYLWDGIKRDRLVWVGDMHPETSTIAAVFGYNDVVPKSLDLARDITPLPGYMNGMISYSMWWILIQHDWYMHNGNLKYLQQQKSYLIPLLKQYAQKVDANNSEALNDAGRFLDWPSSENAKGIHAGLQAMLVMTLNAGSELCTILKDPATARICDAAVARLKKNVPDANGSKQAAALLGLSGLLPADKANAELSAGGVHNYSTFFGYYMLQAKAKAGDYQGGISAIRDFWGPMLGLGATTFWEDFNIDWLPNASRIDELVPEGKKDIHGDYGAYCYKGFRHSLSHGWASGPTPWLTEHVLGVKVIEAGCRVIKIEPHLGDLTFAEGTYPTPYGILKIKHVKLAGGKIKTTVSAPKGVKIIQ